MQQHSADPSDRNWASLPTDDNRNRTVSQYLDRFASKYDGGEASTTVRGHNDHVAALCSRRIYDPLIGMRAFDVDHVTDHPGGSRGLADDIEVLLGGSCHLF